MAPPKGSQCPPYFALQNREAKGVALRLYILRIFYSSKKNGSSGRPSPTLSLVLLCGGRKAFPDREGGTALAVRSEAKKAASPAASRHPPRRRGQKRCTSMVYFAIFFIAPVFHEKQGLWARNACPCGGTVGCGSPRCLKIVFREFSLNFSLLFAFFVVE